MALINLDELQPTVAVTDMRGKFVMLYGRGKIGKTSLAAMWPKPLICCFENGTNGLPGVYAPQMDEWSDFTYIVRQLEDPKMQERYKTVVIDTAGVAYQMAEDSVCRIFGVQSLGDVSGFGAPGYKRLNKEFEGSLRKLTKLGYAIVFVAHDKRVEIGKVDGKSVYQIQPDLPDKAREILNRMVDITFYIGEDLTIQGADQRYLLTRTDHIAYAGSRYAYLTGRLPYNYEAIVDAVIAALKREARERGAEIVETQDERPQYPRSFEDAMEEASALWAQLKNMPQETQLEVQKLKEEYFGPSLKKISDVKADQQGNFELFLADLKKLLNA